MSEDIASGRLGVAGLRHDLDVGLCLEDHADAVANQLVVVGEHDCDPLDGLGRSGIGHAITIVVPTVASANHGFIGMEPAFHYVVTTEVDGAGAR